MSAPPAPPETKLDEIVWRSPPYLAAIGGYITPNNVLHYFRESPFFDRLCNNNSLWTQAQFNPSLASLLHSREALEARLRTMTGIEYTVAAQAPESGLYVIRRQFRRGRRFPKFDLGERPDGLVGDGKMEDVRVEEVFFVIGENVYMAPKIGLALAGRSLSITNHLRNALRKVTALSDFTPSIGYHYISPTTITTSSSTSTSATQPPPSSSSTLPSQAQTPLPNTTTTTGTTSNITTSTSTSSSRPLPFHHELAELRTMPTSLQMSLKFHNEYMDSPPPATAPVPTSSSLSSQPAQVGGAGGVASSSQPTLAPGGANPSASSSASTAGTQGTQQVAVGAGGGSYSSGLGRGGGGVAAAAAAAAGGGAGGTG
ncbi:MED6 mediator sub complex component-domain-containing protein, partial [Peziza echinospora]